MRTPALIITVLLTVFFPCSFQVEVTAYHETEVQLKGCAGGLHFWCRDLQTAKKCGAVKQCIQMVWESETLPPDNSNACKTCQETIQETRNELSDVTAHQELKNWLEETCNVYFISDNAVQECLRLVAEYIPELADIFASKMDSQSVCSVTSFCNSENVNQLIVDLNTVDDSLMASDACQDCKTFAVDAIDSVKKMPEDTFKGKLLSLCKHLSGVIIRNQCASGIAKNANKLYTYFTTQMTPAKFCTTAAMCVDKRMLNKSTFKGLKCDLCINVFTFLKEKVAANSTKMEVHRILHWLCTLFGPFRKQCESYTDNYFDLIYEFLIQIWEPDTICEVIHFCSGLSSSEKVWLPHFNFDIQKMLLEFKNSETTINGENSVCDDCITFAVDAIAAIKILGEAGLRQKVLSQCEQFAPKLACDYALSKNMHMIYAYVTSQMKPNDFCTFATMCNNEFVHKQRSRIDNSQCDLCILIVNNLREIAALNSTRTEIRNSLLWLCSKLGPLKSKCEAYIKDEHFDIVYKSVILSMVPKSICYKVDLCPNVSQINNLKHYEQLLTDKKGDIPIDTTETISHT